MAFFIQSHRWLDGIVPYKVSGSGIADSDRQMIRDAIETWNAEAIVLFKLRKKQSDCVDVRVTHGADGGHSKIGRRGGVETVMSDPAYNPPYARIHELAHAVGMFHEHNRPDRDQFVKVTSTLSNTAFISVRSLIADRPS